MTRKAFSATDTPHRIARIQDPYSGPAFRIRCSLRKLPPLTPKRKGQLGPAHNTRVNQLGGQRAKRLPEELPHGVYGPARRLRSPMGG